MTPIPSQVQLSTMAARHGLRHASMCCRIPHSRLAGAPCWLSQRPGARSVVQCAANAEGEPFTITTPLYYVNAAPHMGSAYPTIAADVASRFHRLLGKKVRFVTGTDEHGEKIAAAAAGRGMQPQEHCDDIAKSYEALWSKLNISYDAFVRTTSSQHETLVREVLARVWDKGDIYKADYEGWYCVDCEEFKDDKEMDEQHNCPTHRKPCKFRKESNYFFRLSAYQHQIEELLAKPGFVEPASRRNELQGLVKEGLRDFSISRAAVSWGIPIPQDPQQTVYVWFDALIGYLSGLKQVAAQSGGAAGGVDQLGDQGWPASVHVIGRDILRFHAVYWPGMLMSAGLPVPDKVFGHGFLTKDGLKMGKALGNTLDPLALYETYGSDAVRFYFMREIIFGQDGDFSEERFCDTVNAALANNLGNMLNRTLSLLAKYCDSKISVDLSSIPDTHPVRVQASASVAAAAAAYTTYSFHEAADAIMALCTRGNQLLEETQPWMALKKGTDEEKAVAVAALCIVLEVVRIAAVMLTPLTPALAARCFQQLNLPEDYQQTLRWSATAWGGLQQGHTPAAAQAVFGRLVSPAELAKQAAQAQGGAAASKGKAPKAAKKQKQAPAPSTV